MLLLEYVYITNVNYIFSIFEESINTLNEDIKVKYFKLKYYLLHTLFVTKSIYKPEE